MFQKIIWKASSSKHDWSNGELLCKLLESALDIGLIGDASWIKIGFDGEEENVQIDDLKQLGNFILEKNPHVTNTIDIE